MRILVTFRSVTEYHVRASSFGAHCFVCGGHLVLLWLALHQMRLGETTENTVFTENIPAGRIKQWIFNTYMYDITPEVCYD